ncbi:MAG: hypothetical protein KA369_13590 [Spirochaetes bacterium]|nr:hypothetical protein [Spirochaetota bacterium]
MKNRRILLIVILMAITAQSCDTETSLSEKVKKYWWLFINPTHNSDAVTIIVNDSGVRKYYSVTLNYTVGRTPREIGTQYGWAIRRYIPDYELMLRSYLHELIEATKEIESWTVTYAMIKTRIDAIRPQLPQAYRDEIEGFAETLSDVGYDADDILDHTYLAYTISLLPDVVRPFACNAFGVDASHSATGKSILYRTLEWEGGSANQLNKMHAIVKYINGSKTFYSIGYLGVMSVVSGINRSKIYAAILDSSTLAHYGTPANPRSYLYDLRSCLETMTSVDDIADYMSNKDGHYTDNGGISPYAYNHLIFTGDATKALVVENFVTNDNVSGFPKHQDVRASADRTRLGMLASLNYDYWYHASGSDGYLPVVNGFLKDVDLSPNYYFDNMMIIPYIFNFARILAIKTQFIAKGGPGGTPFTVEDVKDIIIQSNTTKNPATDDWTDCTGPGNYMFGDVYNSDTQQIMIFQPDDGTGAMKLQVYFAPYMAPLPSCANLKTSFEEITLTLP